MRAAAAASCSLLPLELKEPPSGRCGHGQRGRDRRSEEVEDADEQVLEVHVVEAPGEDDRTAAVNGREEHEQKYIPAKSVDSAQQAIPAAVAARGEQGGAGEAGGDEKQRVPDGVTASRTKPSVGYVKL